jgi:mRNA interferase MazF
MHQQVPDFDDILSTSDPDFASSGLRSESLILLGFLAVLPQRQIIGVIDSISLERHQRLLKILSDYLVK